MKYLGVDFGLKNIGIALGDDETNLAFPIGNLKGGKGAMMMVIEVAKSEGAEAIVIGLPIPDSHQTVDQLERTKQFVQDVQHATTLSVYVVDEQFSSAEARRLRAEYGSNMPEDALAATIILEAFLGGDRGLTLDNARRREE